MKSGGVSVPVPAMFPSVTLPAQAAHSCAHRTPWGWHQVELAHRRSCQQRSS